MAKASKWIGGSLIGLGALTDLGAIAQRNQACPPQPVVLDANIVPCVKPDPTPGLVVGTGMAAAGLWLWNQKTGQGRTRRHASPRRGPRYTGRAR